MKKVIIIIIVLIVVTGLGLTIYGNFFANKTPAKAGLPDMPDVKAAQYIGKVTSTGMVFLTNNYEQTGETIGKRTFVLHGYWEAVGDKFLLRKGDIILDEKVFGKIDIKRRA